MKFSALYVDFNDLCFDPIDLRRPAHAGIKEGYTLKSGYFTVVGSSSVRVADRHGLAAYGNNNC